MIFTLYLADCMGHFLQECCDVGKDKIEKSGELYQAYRAYCLRNGEYTRSMGDFYSEILKRGFDRKKMNTGSMIYGLKLKESLTE